MQNHLDKTLIHTIPDIYPESCLGRHRRRAGS